MENTHKLQERLTLALVCAVALFPAGFVILGLGSLIVAEDVGILGQIPALLYVALAAGLAFVVLGMFALTAPTTARSQVIGRLALAAFVTAMATGIAGLHQGGDGCGGSGRAGLECSD